MYAILNQRTEAVYVRLWQFLRNDLPFEILNWEGLQIVTDFETALRNATRRVIPESRLVGCCFHFNQVRLLIHPSKLVVLNQPNMVIFFFFAVYSALHPK